MPIGIILLLIDLCIEMFFEYKIYSPKSAITADFGRKIIACPFSQNQRKDFVKLRKGYTKPFSAVCKKDNLVVQNVVRVA